MKKIHPGRWLFTNYKTIVLSLIIACISFPKYGLTYASGIDESLPWVFNYLADGHFLPGKNIIFPHGPLAFLLYPLQIGNNVYVAITLNLLCSFLLCMSLFKISRTGEQNISVIAGILILLLSFMDIQLQLIALTVSSIVLFHLSDKKGFLLSAILFSVFNLFIKSYGGLICSLALAGEFIYLLLVKKNVKHGLQIPLGFLLLFFTFWLSLYQTSSHSLSFLRGQYELSFHNSEAASFNQENNWWLIGICLGSLLLVPFISKNRMTRYFFCLMLLPLFGAWKHAMARGEEIHLGGFLHFLMVFVFLFWIISNEKNILATVLCLISVSAFMFNLAINEEYDKQKNIGLLRAFNLYHLIADYDTIAVEKKRITRDNLINKNKYLPDSVLKLLGKRTVDAFPWNYSYIGANRLKWQPRPVIQSYASYTGWLDAQNASHITSGKTAQFVIWELNDRDYNERKLESIDQRYVLNDEPKTILNFFAGYQLKLKTESYLLYEKRPEKLDISISKSGPREKIRYDEWIGVPVPDSNAVLRVKLKINKSFLGVLKSLAYKGELFYAFYELENKRIYSYRIVPENARDGIWLNPFILNPENNIAESPVKRMKIVCLNPRMAGEDIELEFEKISFVPRGSKTGVNVYEHCFNKHRDSTSGHLYFSLNKTETLVNPDYLQIDRGAIKTNATCLSPPFSYILYPGKHTDHLTYMVEAEKLGKDTHFIRFLVEGYVKATKRSNALLVIEQDNQIKWTFGLKDQVVQDNDFWNYICFSQKAHISQLNFDLPYHFYVWNPDAKEKIYVDDFSVTVSGLKY